MRSGKAWHCAIAEFASRNYENASITKIVKQAKIAKGSFYRTHLVSL
ncbi:MAG TPA: TetR family transcriptional regulator [Xenococcaceae cyanobacterium]